jgi:rhamnosyltransferase
LFGGIPGLRRVFHDDLCTDMTTVALIVPVKNGGPRWQMVIASIQEQNLRPQRVIVIDSGSTDGSDDAAREAEFELHTISPECFDHGGTRQIRVVGGLNPCA